ncbi:hypothetical protein A9Q78_02475 [Methylophaga sp. 41_12_T18]|nr:hypothetical protein A9Q78_02475 [Methylophaga sp. 41_12_T18]
MNITKLSLGIMLSIFTSVAIANTKIETIELQHRLATEILADIQPFLPQQSTARAFQNLIIIKSDPDTISEMRVLIEQLDQPLQRIKITVVRTRHNLADQQLNQSSARIEVTDGDMDAELRIKQWSTKNTRERDQHYRAQGIAGNPITISMGQDVPQHEQLIFIGPYGDVAVQDNTRYISLDNGFQAIARLTANQQVHVDIHPIFSQLRHNGTIEKSQVLTTLVGPIGKWIELGLISDEKNIENNGVKRYHSHQFKQQRLYLKVESIPAH